jgi:hypothetical protein
MAKEYGRQRAAETMPDRYSLSELTDNFVTLSEGEPLWVQQYLFLFVPRYFLHPSF